MYSQRITREQNRIREEKNKAPFSSFFRELISGCDPPTGLADQDLNGRFAIQLTSIWRPMATQLSRNLTSISKPEEIDKDCTMHILKQVNVDFML